MFGHSASSRAHSRVEKAIGFAIGFAIAFSTTPHTAPPDVHRRVTTHDRRTRRVVLIFRAHIARHGA